MPHALNGKVAVITGASSGIGLAIARQLAHCGCRLVLTARNETRLRTLAKELGQRAVIAPLDLTDPNTVERPLSMAMDRFGQLDILVLNAGVFSNAPFADTTRETAQTMIDVNLSSVVRMTHAALPMLAQQKRSEILAIGSIAGISDMRNEAVYSATKHALNAFLRSLRRQVAAQGIRVSSILPGTVATELWGLTDPDEIDKKVAAQEVLRAEDIARMAEFTLSQPPHVNLREMVVLPFGQDI